MRSSNGLALVMGLGVACASSLGGELGCAAKKPTELVPGAMTQIQVPGNLAIVKLHVLAHGATAFCQSYRVGPGGEVELPGTLGLLSGAPNTQLDIILTGYDQAALQANSQDAAGCSNAGLRVGDTSSPGAPGPRVLRESVVTYVDQHTLFLPMPLSFSCYDKDCSATAGQACKAGACADTTIAQGNLADFDPSLVDGTQDCFPKACMSATVAAVPVDAGSCLFTFPPELLPAGNGAGLNVAVAYAKNQWVKDAATSAMIVQPGEPLEQEILNSDADEGFTIPDASQPTQFKLADGLCGLWKAATVPAQPQSSSTPYTVISDVQVTVACAVKQALTPFCAQDQQTNVTTQTTPPAVACGVGAALTATPSALYLVVDNSAAMDSAFGASGYAADIGAAFSLPVFKKTYVSLSFLSHNDAECTSGSTKYGTPAVGWGFAADQQPAILPYLLDRSTTSPPADSITSPASLDLISALSSGGVYDYVVALANKHSPTKATASLLEPTVMFFVNRTPVFGGAVDAGAGDGGSVDAGGPVPGSFGADCNPGSAASVQQAIENKITQAPSGVHTDFVVLGNHVGPSVYPFYQAIEGHLGAGATGGPIDAIDGTGDRAALISQVATKVFNQITCAYDLPAGVDTTATLVFDAPPHTLFDSGASTPLGVNLNTACNLANRGSTTVDGWNIDNGRIVVCGHSCQGIQASILAATAQGFAPQIGDGGPESGAPLGDAGITAADVPVLVTMPCPGGK
jgi:hypothetical protein